MKYKSFCCWVLMSTSPIWVTFLATMYMFHVDYALWNPFGGPPVQGIQLQVFTPVMEVDGEVEVRYQYDILRDGCTRDVQIWRLNGLEQLVSVYPGSTKGDGNGARDRTLGVPAGRTLGKHKIRVSVNWHCNPMKSYTVKWPDAEYTVVAATK